MWRSLLTLFLLFSLVSDAAGDDPAAFGWQDDFATAGIRGIVEATTIYQGDLIVAGNFSHAGPTRVNGIARWDGQQWHAMGEGSQVGLSQIGGYRAEALAVFGGHLYLGGHFSSVAGVEVRNIARWDGVAWSEVSGSAGTGVGNSFSLSNVHALHVHDNQLFVGGRFSEAGGIPSQHIAAFDGNDWLGLDGGLGEFHSQIYALLTFDDQLVAAGVFATAGGNQSGGIAVWDGANWSAFVTATDQQLNNVLSLASWQNQLVAGGSFVAGSGLGPDYLARWDGAQWQGFEGPDGGLDWFVNDLLVVEGELLAAGNFRQAGSTELEHVGRWTGNEWLPMPGSDGVGVGPNVGDARSLMAFDGGVLVGGSYWTAGGLASGALMLWQGNDWQELETGGGTGVNGPVHAVDRLDESFYIGGEFTRVDGQRVNHVAFWDGSQWQALADSGDIGLDGPIDSLARFQGDLVVAGRFSQAGSQAAAGLARWDGAAWHPLAVQIEPSWGAVTHMAAFGDELIVGGDFSAIDGVQSPHLARWDGTQWLPLPAFEFPSAWNTVGDLLIHDDSLILAGVFNQVGGQAIQSVARWNGESWSGFAGTTLPDLAGIGLAAAVVNGQLHVGGRLYRNGEPGTNWVHIYRWDGADWQAVPGQFENNTTPDIYSMSEHHGDLVVGGQFDGINGMQTNNLTRWDGQQWLSYADSGGAGVTIGNQPVVYSLAGGHQDLLVGGEFRLTGDVASGDLGRFQFRAVELEIAGWQPVQPQPGETILVEARINSTDGLPEDGRGEIRVDDGSHCHTDTFTVQGESVFFSCELSFADTGLRDIRARFTGSATHSSRYSPTRSLPVLWRSDIQINGVEPVFSAVTGQPQAVQVGIGGQQPSGLMLVSEDSGSHCEVAASAGSCLLFPTAPGTHPLLAIYPGDAHHHPSIATADIEVDEASLILSPSPLIFGTVAAGQASAPLLASLTNPGSSPLDVHVSDSIQGDFARSGGSCPEQPFTLDAGHSCTLEIQFLPMAEGLRQGQLVVLSNSPEGQHGLILFGNGQDFLFLDRFEN